MSEARGNHEGSIGAVAGERSAYARAGAIAWAPTGTDGIWEKCLYEDPTRGERTSLVRMDPGATSPPHAHEGFEQVFVIEGAFRDEHGVLAAGDHCCRAPGAVHGTVSEGGALMLVIYTPAGGGAAGG